MEGRKFKIHTHKSRMGQPAFMKKLNKKQKKQIWLKSYGRGYQTKTNMLLRHAMKSSVRAETEKLEK